jgi:hypothetical protein
VKGRKTEITVETYEILVMSRHGSLRPNWCAACGKQVATISLSAVCLAGLIGEAPHRQTETGRIHLIETVGGSSLICLNSLIQI